MLKSLFLLLVIAKIIDISCINNSITNDEEPNISANISKKRLKILIMNPAIGWSHSQFQGKISDILIEAGHEVVRLFDLSC